MRGISSGVLFITAMILVVEILGYLGVIYLVHERLWKRRVSMLYWLITLVFVGVWLMAFLDPEKIRHTTDYHFFYFVIFISVLNIAPKTILSVFVLLATPFRLLRGKTRSKIILLSGLILSFGVILILGYGIIAGKRTIRIEEIKLSVPSLPEELIGLKIVQLSDLHLVSFENDRFLKRCVDQINRMEPDLILFTGDIVNNYHQEIDGFEDQLKALKAGSGKFAILGNHDYGDYTDWDFPEDKARNLEIIIRKIRTSGFQLLRNQSQKISLRDTSLYIIGVENWGHPPFPQYARLDLALKNVPAQSFSILMSHDPAHWSDQVLFKTAIPLTLSGHTHGGQFAVKLAGMEFSLICFTEKRWGGLYRENNQLLYVNRGLGCVGLPARIDMAPEITVFTLDRE